MRSRLRSALLLGIAALSIGHDARAACTALGSVLAPSSTCLGPRAPVPQPSWAVGLTIAPTVTPVAGEIYVVGSTGEEWTVANGAWADTGDTLAETPGTTFYGGTGVPASTLGAAGNVYVTTAGEVWIDNAGTWVDSGLQLSGLSGWEDVGIYGGPPPGPVTTGPGLLEVVSGSSFGSEPEGAAQEMSGAGAAGSGVLDVVATQDISAYGTSNSALFGATNGWFLYANASSSNDLAGAYFIGSSADYFSWSTAIPTGTYKVEVVFNQSAAAITAKASGISVPAFGIVAAYETTAGSAWTSMGEAALSGGGSSDFNTNVLLGGAASGGTFFVGNNAAISNDTSNTFTEAVADLAIYRGTSTSTLALSDDMNFASATSLPITDLYTGGSITAAAATLVQ